MIAVDITIRDDVRQSSQTVFLKVPQDVLAETAGARAEEFVTAQIKLARGLPLPTGVEIVGAVTPVELSASLD